MSDYRVKPRSNHEIKQLAKRLRDFFDVACDRRIDVIACARKRSIWTVNGERELRLEIRSHAEMGSDDGLTTYDGNLIIIAVSHSVHHAAYMGEGKARNTFAHEFGHAVMHDGTPMSRRTLGNAKFKFIKPFESAEHQAKVFAPAFLINDQIAERLASAEEISVECGVSLESATIYFEQLNERRNREKSIENVRRMADEVREILSPPAPSTKNMFLAEPCSVCRNTTVFPVGHKFMCQTCDTIFDRFQDGDTVDF